MELRLLPTYLVIISVQFSHSVVSDSLRPHGLQPSRLLHPWDFPGKSTGVGCPWGLGEAFLQRHGGLHHPPW